MYQQKIQIMKRISTKDEIKANVYNPKTRKLLAYLFDDNFSTIKEIESALLKKIPFTYARELEVSIYNLTKEEGKTYTIRVNQ